MSSAACILLVEDDTLFRESVRDTLVAAGYRVDEAADGAAAVERIAARHYDLVLLDFDLPKMMGGEALERMLAIRPGLVCLVLSGKDDLHQALWMGRRGAYGWIDKYVGSERLLALVSEGLRTRPRDFDLARLVETHYPQCLAAPFARLRSLPADATPTARLESQRELAEALIEYLGITALATYVERGLLEEELNRPLLAALEGPSIERWYQVIAGLAPRFAAEERVGWWHELATALLRPLPDHEPLARSVELVREQTGEAPAGDPRAVLGWLEAIVAFHSAWVLPARLPPEHVEPLAAALQKALERAIAALSLLADTQLASVRQATLDPSGEHVHHLSVLAGLSVQHRQLVRSHALVVRDVYLTSRVTGEPMAVLSPLTIFDQCDARGAVPEAVFTLSKWTPDRRATYYSHACGHVRAVDSRKQLDALQRLAASLNPQAARLGGNLRDVAVALYDLSGYTTLTRERGPAVAREFVRRMVAAVSASVERHRGIVGGFVGDEVMTHFEDPRAALAAVVETLELLASFNGREPAAALHVHVGLDFGPAVVEGNQVWGDVINRAKRCQMIARRDEAVISSGFAAALGEGHGHVLEPVTDHLKGFGESEVFQVRWQQTT